MTGHRRQLSWYVSCCTKTPAYVPARIRAAMTWGEGDNWTLEADVAGGSYDFKFVVQREGASADESDWEAGANRSLFVSVHTLDLQSVDLKLCLLRHVQFPRKPALG